MDLWIRSQDKTILMKVNRICFERNIDDEPTIYGYENYDNYERLGIYKTKERALEVLDEIQEYIQHDCIDRDFVATIYKMPKE